MVVCDLKCSTLYGAEQQKGLYCYFEQTNFFPILNQPNRLCTHLLFVADACSRCKWVVVVDSNDLFGHGCFDDLHALMFYFLLLATVLSAALFRSMFTAVYMLQ